VVDVHGFVGNQASTQTYTVQDVPPTLIGYTNPSSITLTAGSSSAYNSIVDLQDNNGENDITAADVVLYDADLVGNTCTANQQNCYYASTPSDCILDTTYGTTSQVELRCSVTVWFNALPGTNWKLRANPTTDLGRLTTLADSGTLVTMPSLAAVTVEESGIAYGTLYVGQTSATGITTNIGNVGNVIVDAVIQGTKMCTDSPTCASDSTHTPIERLQQKWAKAAGQNFIWSSQGHPLIAAGGPGDPDTYGCANLDLAIRTSAASTALDQAIYWKLNVPSPVLTGSYTGTTTIAVTSSDSCSGTP